MDVQWAAVRTQVGVSREPVQPLATCCLVKSIISNGNLIKSGYIIICFIVTSYDLPPVIDGYKERSLFSRLGCPGTHQAASSSATLHLVIIDLVIGIVILVILRVLRDRQYLGHVDQSRVMNNIEG